MKGRFSVDMMSSEETVSDRTLTVVVGPTIRSVVRIQLLLFGDALLAFAQPSAIDKKLAIPSD